MHLRDNNDSLLARSIVPVAAACCQLFSPSQCCLRPLQLLLLLRLRPAFLCGYRTIGGRTPPSRRRHPDAITETTNRRLVSEHAFFASVFSGAPHETKKEVPLSSSSAALVLGSDCLVGSARPVTKVVCSSGTKVRRTVPLSRRQQQRDEEDCSLLQCLHPTKW